MQAYFPKREKESSRNTCGTWGKTVDLKDLEVRERASGNSDAAKKRGENFKG